MLKMRGLKFGRFISAVIMAPLAILGITCIFPISAMYADVPGHCVSNCYIPSPSPAPYYSPPAIDYEAERRAREAERARQEAEIRRQEAERLERERIRAEREAQYLRERDEATKTLKGIDASDPTQLKGISGTDSYGLKGVDSGALRQLKSAAKHGADSADSAEKGNLEGASGTARRGQDTGGKNAGDGAIPSISGKKPLPAGKLDQMLSKAAQKNPEIMKDAEIQKSLEWHRQLEKVKADTSEKIAVIEQQQKAGTGDKTALSAHLATLQNQKKDAELQQAKTESKIKERVVNLGLDWSEDEPGETTGGTGAKK